MYTVTFYSYKGGVGRTMGLVNVAYMLAKEGKRVLVVDFDLEAPGLSTYEPFLCARTKQGVLEFVSSYTETNQSPDVSDYIIQCPMEDATVWLMPAGDSTSASYNQRLHSIDWKFLYENRAGFLFIEDMKQQWSTFEGQGFDYVFIDSRTGHTDVGGICTRQLPDSVVVMFVPTPQNIDGLRPIVRSIRGEKAPVRKEKVRLHFCPSNVPDLDDEDSILKTLLDKSKADLSYSENAALIQHYQSLDLLQQPVYAASHPKSKLARQYGGLKTAIVAGNLSDRDGALTALGQMVSRYRDARERSDRNALDELGVDFAFIKNTYPEDPDIALGLAQLANAMIRPEEELAALNIVVGKSEVVSAALLRRALAKATLNDREGAASDIRLLLLNKTVSLFESRSAVELLKTFDRDNWRDTVESAAARLDIESWVRADLLEILLSDREHADRVVELAKEALASSSNQPGFVKNTLILALIAAGRFEEAKTTITPNRDHLLQSGAVQDLFNYGIAEWCLARSVPADIFERFLVLARELKTLSTPNTLQCFALAKAALGRTPEALEDLATAKRRVEPGAHVFSCWRYLSVGDDEMKADLETMETLVRSERVAAPPIAPH